MDRIKELATEVETVAEEEAAEAVVEAERAVVDKAAAERAAVERGAWWEHFERVGPWRKQS